MWDILLNIKPLELVLVDWRLGQDDDPRVLGAGGGVLDDLLQVIFILIERNVLLVIRYTCIVCTKKDGLSSRLIHVSIATGWWETVTYHEAHIRNLRRWKDLGEELNGVSSRISTRLPVRVPLTLILLHSGLDITYAKPRLMTSNFRM